LHNGSLHFLPFSPAGDVLRGRDNVEEYFVRCRASNAYGRIVSRLSKIKPGELLFV